VDHDTRRQKQQALITELIERKIRLHAQQLYDKRGKAEGFALQDWIEAESQVLEKSILAPLYRKTRTDSSVSKEVKEITSSQLRATDSSTSETGA
jgi:hypothetical protein